MLASPAVPAAFLTKNTLSSLALESNDLPGCQDSVVHPPRTNAADPPHQLPRLRLPSTTTSRPCRSYPESASVVVTSPTATEFKMSRRSNATSRQLCPSTSLQISTADVKLGNLSTCKDEFVKLKTMDSGYRRRNVLASVPHQELKTTTTTTTHMSQYDFWGKLPSCQGITSDEMKTCCTKMSEKFLPRNGWLPEHSGSPLPCRSPPRLQRATTSPTFLGHASFSRRESEEPADEFTTGKSFTPLARVNSTRLSGWTGNGCEYSSNVLLDPPFASCTATSRKMEFASQIQQHCVQTKISCGGITGIPPTANFSHFGDCRQISFESGVEAYGGVWRHMETYKREPPRVGVVAGNTMAVTQAMAMEGGAEVLSPFKILQQQAQRELDSIEEDTNDTPRIAVTRLKGLRSCLKSPRPLSQSYSLASTTASVEDGFASWSSFETSALDDKSSDSGPVKCEKRHVQFTEDLEVAYFHVSSRPSRFQRNNL